MKYVALGIDYGCGDAMVTAALLFMATVVDDRQRNERTADSGPRTTDNGQRTTDERQSAAELNH